MYLLELDQINLVFNSQQRILDLVFFIDLYIIYGRNVTFVYKKKFDEWRCKSAGIRTKLLRDQETILSYQFHKSNFVGLNIWLVFYTVNLIVQRFHDIIDEWIPRNKISKYFICYYNMLRTLISKKNELCRRFRRSCLHTDYSIYLD